MDKKTFYRDHLSQSLPCLFKNDAKSWQIYKQIESAYRDETEGGGFNGWMSKMFKYGSLDGIISFKRIIKGKNNIYEMPNYLNSRSIDYKNFTANWLNFTIVSEKMNPNKYMHFI